MPPSGEVIHKHHASCWYCCLSKLLAPVTCPSSSCWLWFSSALAVLQNCYDSATSWHVLQLCIGLSGELRACNRAHVLGILTGISKAVPWGPDTQFERAPAPITHAKAGCLSQEPLHRAHTFHDAKCRENKSTGIQIPRI